LGFNLYLDCNLYLNVVRRKLNSVGQSNCDLIFSEGFDA